jgi:hypothetical protein
MSWMMRTGTLSKTVSVFLRYACFIRLHWYLRHATQIYQDATLFFSQDNVVTIAHVVPTMDCIDAMLSNSATKLLNLAVKHALLFARKLMDKYYLKTDLSNVYCIAMGLSPLYLH